MDLQKLLFNDIRGIFGLALTTILGAFFVKRIFFTKKQSQKTSVLHKEEFRSFPLIEVKTLTDGVKNVVRRFRFGLPSGQSLGLPVGLHIQVRAEVDGETILRSYTPTSSNDDIGYFDLVIKIYPDGKFGQWLEKRKIGDCIEARGPKGVHPYRNNECKKFVFLAGGTGITPCLSVIEHVLKTDTDKTNLALIYGNLTVDDIILKDRIDFLAQKYPKQFSVYYVLDHPPEGWKGGSGYITSDMIERFSPGPDGDVKFGMCGPPPMVGALRRTLKNLGYSKDKFFSY